MIPGNPLTWPEQRQPSAEIQQAMLERYDLDDPLKFYVQYLRRAVVEFDLGPSLHYQDWTVSQIIAAALPVSVQLGLAAVTLALVVGVASGTAAAIWRGGWMDHASMAIALIGISLPTFVTGSALLLVFAMLLRWVPVTSAGDWRQMALAAVTLSLPFTAYIARLTRMGMIDTLSSDFVRTARAKGLSYRRVVTDHALKLAFLPVLSFLGPAAAMAMTGSFVVEKVFVVPGMGQHFVAAVQNKDLFLIMGVVLVYASMLILLNLVVDLAYHLVDPRIEVGGS
jgi:oligopeptide transport system permease protein